MSLGDADLLLRGDRTGFNLLEELYWLEIISICTSFEIDILNRKPERDKRLSET